MGYSDTGTNAFERLKAYADSLESVPHHDKDFRADLYELLRAAQPSVQTQHNMFDAFNGTVKMPSPIPLDEETRAKRISDGVCVLCGEPHHTIKP